MRVKCLKFIDPDTGKEVESSSSLTVGKEYVVLSVHVEDGYSTKFQILRDDGTPSFHIANQFEVISSKIPDTWQIDFVLNSHLSLEPKAWSRLGFWDDYFDGDPEAEAIFDEEKEAMFSHEPGADK